MPLNFTINICRKFVNFGCAAPLRVSRRNDLCSHSLYPIVLLPSLRRTIFELHGGREAQQIPLDLPLAEINPPVSKKNTHWHSTSQELIDALGRVGQEYATPKRFAHKFDLSHTNAFSVTSDPEHARSEVAASKAKLASSTPSIWEPKSILSWYLREVDPILSFSLRESPSPPIDVSVNEALSALLRNQCLQWLSRGGWDVTDLMSWTWILKASHADRAADRLAHAATACKQGDNALPIPHFLFHFLLRRQNFSAKGLRHLLHYAWKVMNTASNSPPNSDIDRCLAGGAIDTIGIAERTIASPKEDPRAMQEDVFIIMVIRLLRHARQEWPAACETITSMFCTYLNGLNFQPKQDFTPRISAQGTLTFRRMNDEDQARLSFVYNTVLKLLALPASLQPFVSGTIQLRAQRNVLQRMDQFDPPLVVDRRGCRAVTSVFLMQKKTSREREWASLQGKKWPPFKEERSGMDAHKDVTLGYGPPMEALRDASEAGYPSEDQDDAASIMSGWDTDGSPTIKTRGILLIPGSKASEKFRTWVSRIRATRTLNEAWAIFLEFEEEIKKPNTYVYHAMLDKLVRGAPSHLYQSTNLKVTDVLPGDGLELSPEPALPRDRVYVRRQPPTLEAFFDFMINQGLRLNNRIVGPLLVNATSLSFVTKILNHSALPDACTDALLKSPAGLSDVELRKRLQEVPPAVFDALLVVFCQHNVASQQEEPPQEAISQPDIKSFAAIGNPLTHALRLLKTAKPARRKPYIHLLSALRRPGIVINSERGSRIEQDLLSWLKTQEVLCWMDYLNIDNDLRGFVEVCGCLEKALFASAKVLAPTQTGRWPIALRKSAEEIFHKALPIVEVMFKDCVREDAMLQEVPSHLLNQKAAIDREVVDGIEAESAEATERDVSCEDQSGVEEADESESQPFLPPKCLLPTLLEVPRPAYLHQFIRVLGLCNDYNGMLELINWMALHNEDIQEQAEGQRGGSRMLRRCIIATRVFLERSWTYYPDIPDRERHVIVEREVDPSPREVWEGIRQVISEIYWWGGWPSDDEVEEYVYNGRFM